MSLGKSVGSLETWEPEDKSFSKHVISDGIGDIKPNDGAVCSVNLSLVDAVEVEESLLGDYKLNELVEVTIGEGDTAMSEMLDKVLCSMKEKETCYVKTKIDISGKRVDDLMLLKNKQLKFNVVLQSVNRAAELVDLEPDEKLERAQHHKDKGTQLFKDKRTVYSVKRYKKALTVVQDSSDPAELPESLRHQWSLVKCQCYLNLGACYLRAEKYNEAIGTCSHALRIEEHNVKGLFRRGQAYLKLHKYPDAFEDFQKVLLLEPENKAAQNELNAVQAAVQKEKKLYKKMFDSK